MPPQRQQSDILAKYRDRAQQAHEAHASDETEYSQFGELPDGINGGIAQLVEVKVDAYKTGDLKGEPFFYMAGIVVSPAEHKGIHTKGMRTSITEALCDTPKSQGTRKTFDDHYAWVLNQMRMLGLVTEGTTFDDFEPMMQALKESAPFFRFRTWKGDKQTTGPYAGKEPRTQNTWEGYCDPPPGLIEDDPGAGVQDSTTPAEPVPAPAPAPTPSTNGPTPSRATPTRVAQHAAKAAAPRPAVTQQAAAAPATPAAAKTAPRPAAAKAAPAKAPEPAPQFDEFGDIDSLLEKANAMDEVAQKELIDFATKAGATAEDIEKCQTWEQVVALFAPSAVAVESPAAAEPEPEVEAPAVGECYFYRPMNPKTRKPSDKPVQCEVTAVGKGTVELRSLEDAKKVYKSVKWDALETE